MKNSLISSTIKTKKKVPYLIYILLGAFIVLVLLSILFGSSNISIKEFIEAIIGTNDTAKLVILYIRIPRTLAAIIVGAALGVSGLILQSTLNNSLASPGIIGINSGSSLAIVITSLIFPISIIARSLGAFIGAFLTAILVYLIARVSGAKRTTIILSGIAISSLFAAISNTIIDLDVSSMLNKTTFSIGSLRYVTNEQVLYGAIVVVVGLVLALIIAPRLMILSLGDDVASSLGMNVKLTRFISLLISALLASAAVSIGGLLSFLGLIAPHIVRKIVGNSNMKRLIVLTIFFGADITILCDILSRVLLKPYELPLGVFLAVIGVPFFLFLLFSKGRRERLD